MGTYKLYMQKRSTTLTYVPLHINAGQQTVELANLLQEALLALALEIEHGEVTLMLVPRAALVQDSNNGAPLRVWGLLKDKPVRTLGLWMLKKLCETASVLADVADFAGCELCSAVTSNLQYVQDCCCIHN